MFIRPFFLMKGWRLGTRLDVCNNVMLVVKEFSCPAMAIPFYEGEKFVPGILTNVRDME